MHIMKDTLERFKTFKHENIVHILDNVCKNFDGWVVMENCELGNMKEYIEHNNPDLDSRIGYMEQAARGLQYLHSQKPSIWHSSIQLTSLLLQNQQGRTVVKLTSFSCLQHALKTDFTQEMESIREKRLYWHHGLHPTMMDIIMLGHVFGDMIKDVGDLSVPVMGLYHFLAIHLKYSGI